MTDKYTLTLSNNQVCDIRAAINHLITDFRAEAMDPNTNGERRIIAKHSAAHWQRLRDEIIRQHKEQQEGLA